MCGGSGFDCWLQEGEGDDEADVVSRGRAISNTAVEQDPKSGVDGFTG